MYRLISLRSMSLTLLVVFCFIYLPPSTAPAVAHDFLDSIFGYYVLWSRHTESLFILDYVVPELSGGQPINTLAMSEFGGAESIYRVFEPFTAFVFVCFLQWCVAFSGMYLILKDYVFNEKREYIWIAVFVAALFTLISHKPSRVMVEVGVPILIWAFMNVYLGKRQLSSFFVIVAYPVFSPFHYGGYTLCGYSLILCFVAFFFKRENFANVCIAFGAIVSVYLIKLYRMFYHWFFNDSYESIRHAMKAYNSENGLDFSVILHNIFENIILRPGNHHLVLEVGYLTVFLWIVFFVYIYWNFFRFFKCKISFDKGFWLCFCLMILVSFNSAIYIIDQQFHPMEYFLNIPLPLHRMDVASLPIILIIFALVLRDSVVAFSETGKMAISLVFVCLLLVVLVLSTTGFRQKVKWVFGFPTSASTSEILPYLIGSGEFPETTIKPTSVNGWHRRYEVPLLGEYFESDALEKISEDLTRVLGKPKKDITTISFGLSPSLSWYHGYKTLDGRYYDVSVESQKVFDEIFKSELVKDNRDTAFLTTYIAESSVHKDGVSPDLNTCKFRASGGDAILSLYPLLNAEDLGFDTTGVYQGTFDPIYVYNVARVNCQ